ncbi:hypothetical protein ACFYYM_31775 [Streptomyces erythrochromogenes]|uniref:hypothetical protein n=1 Tax=Streptomyces erythrochromogenes TaxID=285574 RepID=UPI0036BA48AB
MIARMGMPTVQYTVAVMEERLRLLDLVAAMAAGEERAWLAKQREGHRGLRGGKLAQARKATRELLAERREAGALAGSRDWLLVPGVVAELKARNWDQEWPPIPPGALGAGRRWGTDPVRYSAHHDEGESRFLGRLGVRLPHELGERLQRACYWHNAEIEKELQKRADQWGDGPDVIRRQSIREHGGVTVPAAMAAALRETSPAEQLDQRRELRAKVVTTGDILRAALDHALVAAPERARREHTRLRAAAVQAGRDIALAEECKQEAEDDQRRATEVGSTEDIAKAANAIAHWNSMAVTFRLEAERVTAKADAVGELTNQLKTRS